MLTAGLGASCHYVCDAWRWRADTCTAAAGNQVCRALSLLCERGKVGVSFGGGGGCPDRH